MSYLVKIVVLKDIAVFCKFPCFSRRNPRGDKLWSTIFSAVGVNQLWCLIPKLLCLRPNRPFLFFHIAILTKSSIRSGFETHIIDIFYTRSMLLFYHQFFQIDRFKYERYKERNGELETEKWILQYTTGACSGPKCQWGSNWNFQCF